MYRNLLILLIVVLSLGACGAARNADDKVTTAGEIRSEDKTAVSLLNQIRRKSGIRVEGSVPMLISSSNSLTGSIEPLYVVDGYIVGNSFASVKDVVNSADVKSIQVIKAADASFYGARGANGVIKIVTNPGN